MATITANSSDGFIQSYYSRGSSAGNYDDNLYVDCRQGDGLFTLSVRDTTATSDNICIRAKQYTYGAAPGTKVLWFNRTFIDFDTSGISEVPTDGTLQIYGYSQAFGDVIAVKSDHTAAGLQTSDYTAINGCSSQLAASDGDGTGTFASCATVYGPELSTWTTLGYNSFTLSAAALSDIASLSTFKVALLNHDNDYLDIDNNGSNFGHDNGLYFSEESGKEPKLVITEAPSDPVAFNEFKVKNSNLNIKNSDLKFNPK